MTSYNLCFSNSLNDFYIFEHSYIGLLNTLQSIPCYLVNAHSIFDYQIKLQSIASKQILISDISKICPISFIFDPLTSHTSNDTYLWLQNTQILSNIGHSLVDAMILHKSKLHILQVEKQTLQNSIANCLSMIQSLNTSVSNMYAQLQASRLQIQVCIDSSKIK